MSIYDPSDISNDINGFNVVKCCEFRPAHAYIMIPGLGYGFVSRVVDSFDDKLNKVTPGRNFSIQIEPDEERQSSLATNTLVSKSKFAIKGSGLEVGHMMMAFPLNAQCAKKITITPTLKVPIPFRIRDIGSSQAVSNVLTHKTVSSKQVALFGMMMSVAAKESGDSITDTITKALCAEHFRMISSLGVGEKDKFTGNYNISGNRVELADIFYDTLLGGGSTTLKSYKSIVGNNTTDVPWDECLLRPSVFVSFEDGNGNLRVFYSPTLTTELIKLIRIEGCVDASSIVYGKNVYAFGISSAYRSDMQDWITCVDDSSISSYTGLTNLDALFTGSVYLPEEMVHDDGILGNIVDMRIMNGVSEISETATLMTPMPPLFTEGEAYRESCEKDDDQFYIPFTQAYLLPVVAYSKTAADAQEGCQMCGGTALVGFNSCSVCFPQVRVNDDGTKRTVRGIRCPNCITNTEERLGQVILRPGYLSSSCTRCNSYSSGNDWVEYASVLTYSGYYSSEYGKIPCPACAPRALQAFNQALSSNTITAALDAFVSRLGKGPGGTGTCSTCDGAGKIICPECAGNEEVTGSPGYHRSECPFCYDSSSSEYRGLSTPTHGLIECNDSNLELVMSYTETREYYEHLYENNAPTCNGTGLVGASTCPACNGTGLSYRFRGIDFSLASAVGSEYDAGSTYVITESDCTTAGGKYSLHDPTYIPYGVPYATEVTIEFSNRIVQEIESKTGSSFANVFNRLNKAVYIKASEDITQNLDVITTWEDDTLTGLDHDDIPYKWVPPYAYKIEGTTMTIYKPVYPGCSIVIYIYPNFSLTGTVSDTGYTVLDAGNSPASAGTIYDGGAWLYVESSSSVPLLTGIGSMPISLISDYTYLRNTDTNSDKIYHMEGFAHLSEAIRRYYSFIGSSTSKASMQHIGTAKVDNDGEPPARGVMSRWLYAPENVTKKLTGANNDDSWIALHHFDDLETIDRGFKISGENRNSTIAEVTNPSLPDIGGVASKNSSSITSDDHILITSAFNSISDLSSTKVCIPELEYMFTHVTKAAASKILNNSSSEILEAKMGTDVIREAAVSVTASGEISIESLFSSCVPTDDLSICNALLNAIEPLGQMISTTKDVIWDLLIKVDASTGEPTSPALSFENSGIVHILQEEVAGTPIDEIMNAAKDLVDSSNPKIVGLVDNLRNYKSDLEAEEEAGTGVQVIRPANLTRLAILSQSNFTNAVENLNSAASRLIRSTRLQREEDEDPGSDDFKFEVTFAGRKGNTQVEVKFTPTAVHKGFLVYNLRKTYLVMISMISLIISLIERIFVYLHAFDKGYEPFPVYVEDEEGPLEVYSFTTSDVPCYPKVKKDITISSLDQSTVSLNSISQFADSLDSIKYDVKLDIPDIEEAEVKPVPILGMGVDSDDTTLFGGASSYEYPFEQEGIFENMVGDTPTVNIESDLDLPPVTDLENIHEDISIHDFMYYKSNGSIGYVNGLTDSAASISKTPVELRQTLENSVVEETSPSVSSVSVGGEVSMSDAFAFISDRSAEVPMSSEIAMDNIVFNSGKPSIHEHNTISGLYMNSLPLEGGSTDIFLGSVETIAAEVRKASNGIFDIMEKAGTIHTIYNKWQTDNEDDFIFPFIGQADTNLGNTQGDSAMMCYMFKQADCTLKSEYLSGVDINDAALATSMGHSTNWKTSTGSTDHQINYNLWLSKRRASLIFVMVMSALSYDYRSKAPEYTSGKYYRIGDVVDYQGLKVYCTTAHEAGETIVGGNWSSTEPTETISVDGTIIACKYATYQSDLGRLEYRVELIYSSVEPAGGADIAVMKPFHCYGFGALLQKEDKYSASEREKQRVAKMLSSSPASREMARLWAFNHLDRVVSIPLCHDIITAETDTIIAPDNSYLGGWALPKYETSGGVWKDKWSTTNAGTNGGLTPAQASTRTNSFLSACASRLVNGSIDIEKLKVVCSNPSDQEAINSAINNFLSTSSGMGAFAVPRSQILADKVWLRITKL